MRIEPALLRIGRLVPRAGDLLVVRVGSRAAAARIDQPERVADTGEPRYRLGTGLGRRSGCWNGLQVKHALPINGQG
jgi:hypothetical protein